MNTTSATVTDQPYTFDNDTSDAAVQVHLLAAIMDPDSIAILDTLGISPGWRCLDVGPGAGSITTWLAAAVGSTGHVTALDINPRHVTGRTNITIEAGDIRTADLPANCYDIIHARLVLMHLPTREAVLDRLVPALKPGGWLVISEWDLTHPDDMALHLPTPEATQAFITFQRTVIALAAGNGAEAGWARRVPCAMRTAGLHDIRASVDHHLWHGGESGCLLHKSNSQQLEGALLRGGMNLDQLATLRKAMTDPETMTWHYPLVTTVGRRPTG